MDHFDISSDASVIKVMLSCGKNNWSPTDAQNVFSSKSGENKLDFCLSNMQFWFDPTRVGGFNQHESLKMCSDYRELSNASDLKLDLNAQTQSPWTALLSHLITSHSYDFYLALFSCLHSLLVALNICLLFPQVPQESPAEDHQAGYRPGGRLHQVGSSAPPPAATNSWKSDWASRSKELISFTSHLWCNKLTASWGWCDTAAAAVSHLIVSVCSQEVHSITLVLIRLTSITLWQK